MLKALSEVNGLAVGIAVVAVFSFGAVWFMLVVGRAYKVALALESPPRPTALSLVGPLLCQAVIIMTTAVMIRALRITTYPEALAFGLIVGIGYLTPMVVNIALNPKFPRPMLYSLINAPFFVLGSVIAATILVAIG